MSPEAEILKMTKPQLADVLIAHGVIYPDRAGILKWSKDEMQNEALGFVYGPRPAPCPDCGSDCHSPHPWGDDGFDPPYVDPQNETR